MYQACGKCLWALYIIKQVNTWAVCRNVDTQCIKRYSEQLEVLKVWLEVQEGIKWKIWSEVGHAKGLTVWEDVDGR